MMYVNLILRNLKRSTKEYAIYMMTLILSVMLMYAFNGVAFSKELGEIISHMEGMLAAIIMAGVFVVCILGWLVYYISNFILKKRSREFGMYMLMGMTRKQISYMFLGEQICMGVIAFIVGSLLGMVAYQVLYAIIMHLFEQVYAFKITLSVNALGLTFLYFILVYMVEIMRERVVLRKKKIHDLLFSERMNEERKEKKIFAMVCFVLGIIAFFSGLKILDAAFAEVIGAGLGLIGSVSIIVLSIFLLYFGLSHVISGFINRRKSLKYKGNMLYLSTQICTRLKTSRVVLSLLTILTLTSFLLVTLGLKFNDTNKEMTKMMPFDIVAQSYKDLPLKTKSISSYLEEHHIGYTDHKYHLYELDHPSQQVVKGTAWTDRYPASNYVPYMRYSDYQTLMTMLGYDAQDLAADEYIIMTSEDHLEVIKKNAEAYDFAGLHFKSIDLHNLGEGLYDSIMFVVPDAVLMNAELKTNEKYVVKTEKESTKEWGQAIEEAFINENTISEQVNYLSFNTKFDWLAEGLMQIITFTFTLFYIAAILSFVSATVLAIQQMSDVWKQKKSYEMLWKMGVDKREIYKLMRKQIAINFFVPFIIPVIYIFPIIISVDRLFEKSYSNDSMLPLALMSIIFYLVIYICYYTLAYVNSKRSIDHIR